MASLKRGWFVLMLAILSTANVNAYMNGWCAIIDVVLPGRYDALNRTMTHKQCHLACAVSAWCQSSNYGIASGRCEPLTTSLLSASDRLVPRQGWVYSYTNEKVGAFDNQAFKL